MPPAPPKSLNAPAPGPYAIERIENEIAHLRKRESARHGPGHARTRRLAWFFILLGGALLWLFFMDPVLHAVRRSQAIRDYLYLHHYGSENRANELMASKIFSPNEIVMLNRRPGDFRGYYASPVEANRTEKVIVDYLQGVENLHRGKSDDLDVVGQIRFAMFIRLGINPPTQWNFLDPAITN